MWKCSWYNSFWGGTWVFLRRFSSISGVYILTTVLSKNKQTVKQYLQKMGAKIWGGCSFHTRICPPAMSALPPCLPSTLFGGNSSLDLNYMVHIGAAVFFQMPGHRHDIWPSPSQLGFFPGIFQIGAGREKRQFCWNICWEVMSLELASWSSYRGPSVRQWC